MARRVGSRAGSVGGVKPVTSDEPETDPYASDRRCLEALRSGDEDAFRELVERHGPGMLRVARANVSSPGVAEEVVQEAWVGVLKSLDRFEGRSSLSTWIYRILINTARSRMRKEGRSIPFSSLIRAETGGDEPSLPTETFLSREHAEHPGGWAMAPAAWPTDPDGRLIAGETRERISAAIDALPPAQQTVISLRDIEGWSSEEVRNALEISESNQRVLLHRARSKVRKALADYVGDE